MISLVAVAVATTRSVRFAAIVPPHGVAHATYGHPYAGSATARDTA